MGESTGISWANKTWSPWRGCTKVSEGCRNCYAEGLSGRNPKVLGEWGPNGTRVVNANWEKPRQWSREAEKAGRREKVFPSLCDPFEDFQRQMSDHRGNLLNCSMGLPVTMSKTRGDFFDLIDMTPWLDWLVLTKRPENIRSMWPVEFDNENCPGHRCSRENVWLGTSVEDQETADVRIPELLKCRDLSPVLWLSVEPLLGPIDLSKYLGKFWECPECGDDDEGGKWLAKDRQKYCGVCAGDCGRDVGLIKKQMSIDWVIIGNESNGKKNGRFGIDPAAGACDWHEWAFSIISQCRAAGVAVFVKQIPLAGIVEKNPANFLPEFQVQEFPAAQPPLDQNLTSGG